MSLINQYQINIARQVEDALAEDLGGQVDISNDITAMLIDADTKMRAHIITTLWMEYHKSNLTMYCVCLGWES